MRRVGLSQPQITDDEITEVTSVLRSGWITTGPKCAEFAADLARFVEAPRVELFSSCTDAIELALRSVDVDGGIVLTSAMGFPGTMHAIERAGGRPWLCDVDPATGLIDVDLLERMMNGNDVRAVIPVHLNGMPADMTAIDALCAGRDVAIVEDAAHALPASVDGRTIGDPSGPIGVRRLTAFSFQATKTLTTAEGGALTGPDDLLDEAVRWRLHGMSRDVWTRHASGGPTWRYDIIRPGLKSNMSDVHAAIGVAQLRRAWAAQSRRCWISGRYDVALGQLDGVDLLPRLPGRAWSRYVYPLFVDPARRNQYLEQLAAAGVGSSVYFIPLHEFSHFRDFYGDAIPGATEYSARHLAIPCHAAMSNDDVDYVVDQVTAVLTS